MMRSITFGLLLFALLVHANAGAQKKAVVQLRSRLGMMHILLHDDTPLHRDNFVRLAKQKFYNGTTFHRVIKDFMIQGGDPFSAISEKKDSIGQGGPGYTIPAEIVPHLFHQRGALAAARMGDDVNPARASSGSQFYIVQGKTFKAEEQQGVEQRVRQMSGNPEFRIPESQWKVYMEEGGSPWLDGHYTVFGKVIDGMEVIDRIAGEQVDEKNNHRPLEDVTMKIKVKYMTDKQIERLTK